MTKKETTLAILQLIDNGYAETHVGYHAEYREWNGYPRRDAYAQIAAPFGGTKRIYERSYAELLTTLLTTLLTDLAGEFQTLPHDKEGEPS